MPRAFLLLLVLVLAACDSGAPGELSLDDYEGAEGEAVVRHVLKTLPPIAPEVPKVYTVVKGPHLKSTSLSFMDRMDDLKLTFVSGEVLTLRDPDKSIVDPRSGLSPVTIQLAEIRSTGHDRWQVVYGWAWKKIYERSRGTLTRTTSGYEVSAVERIEGNYVKPDAE